MNIKQLSYIYGLLGTDGYLLKHNELICGIAMEVSIKDKDIVEKLYKLIPYSSIYYRKRNTNYKQGHESIVFAYNRKDFPQKLIEMGFPIEDKTNKIAPPICEYDELSFWRGIIDGDGSLGYKSDNSKFISLTTKSEELRNSFCKFLHSITNKDYNPKRNKRDNIYNIGCCGTSAEKVVKKLYESICEDDIYLDRKFIKMKEILFKK